MFRIGLEIDITAKIVEKTKFALSEDLEKKLSNLITFDMELSMLINTVTNFYV